VTGNKLNYGQEEKEMEHAELRCLCDYFNNAGLAANTLVRPTPLAVNGELELDERGEVVYAEVWSPVDGGNNDEALKKIIIMADGHEVPFVHLCGVREAVMAPPKDRMWAGKLYSFGTPMSSDPLKSTTIKYKQNITVACQAGPASAGPAPAISPITAAFRIRLWGYVYKEEEISNFFGTMVFTGLRDKVRNRTLTLTKTPIRVTASSWLTLPGGKDQSIPKINPVIMYAQNLVATDGMQGDYQLRFQPGNVVEEDENMYWEFDEKDAIFLEGLGIKAGSAGFLGTNLARVGFRIDGDYHPKGPTTRTSLYPVTIGINERNYGWAFPYQPITDATYVVIPKLERPLLIWNEIGMVVIRDDGVGAVPIDGVQVALTGIRLEMRA